MVKRICRFMAGLALLLSAVGLGGCGRTAVHEELNSRAEEPTVIRIAWWGGEERHETTRQVLELYSESHPGVVFEPLTYSWNDYFDMLSLETARGNMPDLIQMDYQYINTYSENGSLADLTPFVEDGTIRTEDMDGKILDSGRIDGRFRGMAMGIAILSMVYNPEVFEEAGIPFPEQDWTWEDFVEICLAIKERTGKYGVAMTPVLDLNLYRYWLRQRGERLFAPDGHSLGYEDDSLYVGYVTLFKTLMDAGAAPVSERWADINAGGQEELPVVRGECGMIQEWNNYPVKVSQANGNLKLVTPPLAEGRTEAALWMKPGMFWCVAETSGVKEECARFIDWFLNSSEANAVLKGDRGVPISGEIRKSLLDDEALGEVQREMFRFTEEAAARCGDTPPPEPAGVDGLNQAFSDSANAFFYEVITAEEAAARFRQKAEEILGEYGE